MYGPRESGFWSKGTDLKRTFEFLKAGGRYKVCKRFADFDGDLHMPGEEWTFLGSSFAPHEDGLSLFISLDGSREWQIRMMWRPEAQGRVIDELASYLKPA